MKYTKAQTQEALGQLQRNIQPGQTLRTIVTHVSRSGMSRSIRVLDGFNDISWLVARVLDESMDDRNGGIRVSGCGMDMGFDIVYRLGYRLWPNGYNCIGENCHDADHSNGMPQVQQYTKDTCPGKPCGDGCDHIGAPQVHHKSGGYALRQQWL